MRIKEKDLEMLIDRVNKEMDFPEKPYIETDKGYEPAPENIHLDFAYGGVSVEQMLKSSGVEKVLHGYHTKKEAHLFLQGLVKGIELAKNKFAVPHIENK